MATSKNVDDRIDHHRDAFTEDSHSPLAEIPILARAGSSAKCFHSRSPFSGGWNTSAGLSSWGHVSRI